MIAKTAPKFLTANYNSGPWQKKLYIEQGYPDDYVDKTFLIELQKNANVKIYEYWTVVAESIVVTQQFSSILIFISIFIYLYNGHFSEAMRMLRGVVNFGLILYFLSPVLRTLTEDTSSDTIWALTVLFFILNLTFHDYGTKNLTSISTIGSISVNAAVLACVLLASRLSRDSLVFAFMLFAILWFALFPLLRRLLIVVSKKASIALTVILCVLGTVLFIPISKAVSLTHIFLSLFITFIFPVWLIWTQRYKNEIHGPWDEATPIVHK
ncbi:hypothetical protein BB561_005236 [Smittium simulii]|uniref:Phosphatidylinositol N-acetylglucosaminyltransferase n=1 Tax=Smittium simulii TaxID=133385 RepID=A0A2T9YBF7_9FUNG|nr:hypothetical protein BB561_005236 [Smittium simulii]